MECQHIIESIIKRSHDRCERINFNIQQGQHYNGKALECVLRLQKLVRRLTNDA